MDLPLRARLHLGDRGLFCRVRMSEDERGAGKIFMPDRSCADKLHQGIVKITRLIDKGTYGFFVGEMIKQETPSDEQVIDYICSEGKYADDYQFCESEVGGYVTLKNRDYCYSRTVLVNDQDLGFCESLDLYFLTTEDSHKVNRVVNGVDLVCNHFHGCKYNDLYSRFVQYDFDIFYGAYESTRYVSDLFDDAVDSFLSLRVSCGVEFVVVNGSRLINSLHLFSKEEIDEIIEEVNKINTAANQLMTSKIKKGKVRLEDVRKRSGRRS